MMRYLFGALLSLLVTFPSLLPALAVIGSQPPVLAFAAGALLWPRINRRIRGWTS
ncbi:hypothetical protein [Streptomyces sp. WAC 01529]|uniref:hypothetical protein n=1 Tax=Streptomyces sp. WAC 01529 TaxID=2203205 RepID=UPI0013E08DCF|nr:hypothetical protein [Streptomyces sp. WAC 01529]